MWGLPWGLLCGTSGRKELYMVPCHSCHIYGIWTSRSKKVWGMLKSHQLGVAMQVIGKAGSHFVILLYCETLLQVWLGIYCKWFWWIHLFTILLMFYMFEVGKAKSATQSVIMILPLNGLFQRSFRVFYFTPENSILYCNFWLQPSFWYKHLFPHSLTRIHYCNWKYISGWSFFQIKNFYFSIK